MSSAAQRQRYKRQQRQKQQAYQIQAWLKRFDLNRSGALEREELAALLTHLHPEKPPDSKALDLLIEKATEVRTYSMNMRGDRNGRVYPEKLFKVVGTYAAYVLADSAFARLDHGTGVMLLKDLPALVSEARAAADGASTRDDEVSFVLGSVANTTHGDVGPDFADDVSIAASLEDCAGGGALKRDQLLPALARMSIHGKAYAGHVEDISDGDSTGEVDESDAPACDEPSTAGALGDGKPAGRPGAVEPLSSQETIAGPRRPGSAESTTSARRSVPASTACTIL